MRDRGLTVRNAFLCHPNRVVNLLKEISDIIVKILEDSNLFLASLGTVSERDKFVENLHDDVVVVAALSVLEGDIGVVEKIIGENFDVVDFFDNPTQGFVRVKGGAQGILQG